MLDTPLTERTGQLTSEAEREELRLALVSAQESLAVQILLESCLETEEDAVSFSNVNTVFNKDYSLNFFF